MSYQLPPNMLRLFQPRPQLPHQKNLTRDIDPRKRPQKTKRQMNGMAAYLEQARQDAADKGEVTDEVPMAEEDGEIEEGEAGEGPSGEGSSNGVRASNGHQRFTLAEQTRRELLREQKRKRIEDIKARGMASYDPSKDPEAQGDPFCTLFVSRLDFEVTEKDLHRTFDMYGPIQRIRIVRDKTGKSRGYAFVVYEKERDMRAAYKDTEGIKIKGRRAMVDVERGRTVRDWKPMRLGGGLGGLARKKKEPPPPEPAFTASRGGFRGGFRGGPPRGGGGFGARGGGRFGGPPPMGGGYGGGPPPMAAPGGYGMAPQGGFGGGYGAGNGGYGPPRGGGGDGYGRFDGPPAKRGRY